LRHAEIEAYPMGERPEIERFGKSFAVPAAPAAAGAIGSVHFQPHFARRHIRISWMPNYTLYNAADIRLNIAKSW
jgi:hypothetical protein